MKEINLREYYPELYTKDSVISVSDEIAEMMHRSILEEKAYQRRLCRYQAYYSLGQHRTIAEASAVESPIRQETIGFPAHFFARAHNFKPPGRACQPEADSPMRT